MMDSFRNGEEDDQSYQSQKAIEKRNLSVILEA